MGRLTERNQKKEKEKKKEKAKYGMWSNSCYMVRRAWRECRSVLLLIGVVVGVDVAKNLLQLFVVPVMLGRIEAKVPLAELVETILFFAVGLVVTGVIGAYVRTNQFYGRVTLRTMIVRDIHDKINRTSYPNMDMQEFLNQRVKAVNSTANNNSAAEAIWGTLEGLVKNVLGFAVYLFLLVRVDPVVIAVTLLTTFAGYGLTLQINKRMSKLEKENLPIYHRLDYIRKRAQDVALAKDIRIFNMKGWLTKLYEKSLNSLAKFLLRRERAYFGKDTASVILNLVRNGVAYLYLVRMVLGGSMGAAEFLLYFSAITTFTAWVEGILTSLADLHKHGLDISYLREFLEYKEPFLFEEGEKLEPAADGVYEIELQNVSFRYPSAEQDIIHNLNLKIRRGEKLAVVGLNGAGKTTLIKLVCGFLDPTEGSVLLNGEDICKFNRRDYYRHFAAVFQEYSLFAGSIAENVAQTEDEIDMERVRDCIEKAGMKQKIEALPQGYDTYLGREVYENAIELSGGESQRLMLARALYKNAPIIVLDEPTAALDPLAESDMYERYHELTGERTSVYISHRLASTRFCNRIILLDGGEIKEEGTHESLLAAGGEYARLFEMQSQYYREGGTEDAR